MGIGWRIRDRPEAKTVMVSFSVIMATRNRPELFKIAVGSVLSQSLGDREIIVVQDGPSAEDQAAYRTIAADMPEGAARWYSLVLRPNGHGQSYVLNFGAERARGKYLCFLDDDDYWIDPEHLARAHTVLTDDDRADLYLTNQVAFLLGKPKQGPIWIEDLEGILSRRGRRADLNGAYTVSVDELLMSHGFCHLNTLIVKRDLYLKIGGMDEGIRWECDRDLYFRLLDKAELIKFDPKVVSRHNVPDPAKATNMTTAVSELERRLFQLRVLDRAILFSGHAEIRAYGRRHKAYALKKIAEYLDRAGHPVEAAFYAREALGAGPTAKWGGYATWLNTKRLVRGDK